MAELRWLVALAMLALCLATTVAQDDALDDEDYDEEPEEGDANGPANGVNGPKDDGDGPTDDYDAADDYVPAEDEEGRAPSDDYSVPGQPTKDCVCVPFYQCKDGNIVSDGTNLIDPRRRTQVTELPPEEKYESPSCGPFHQCCTDPEASTVKPYEHRCGSRNPSGINGRILSAQGKGEAEFGEWPWQAAILEKSGAGFVFKCGGTLIDEKHVLTVAHCAIKFMDSMDKMVVRLGEWDTQVETEFLPHEDLAVEAIVIHPDFKTKSLFNDLAVLRLSEVVHFKPHIDTACLPRPEDDFSGKECIVTGWGTNAYKSGAYSLVMKEIALPVLSHDDCQHKLRMTRLGRYFKLHKSFLCAGGEEGKDACKGDGGGPLVCYRSDNSYTLAGLVAWGIDCGQPGVPGVYVNVKQFIDWISSVTHKSLDDYWSS